MTQQRRPSSLSLSIGLCLALLASLLQGATSQISDVELCACSPRVYELTFDFDLECEPINVDFDSGGIADATCHVNGFDNINVTDLVPVAVSSVQLIEIGQGGAPIAVEQYTGDYRDGDSIEYESISFEGVVAPRAFQVRALGRNEGGDPLVLQWAVTYSNNCGVWPVLEVNDSVGWTIFTGLARPLAIACPAVIIPETDEPTASPTVTPTLPPTDPPTVPPTLSPTETPTVPPTQSPTVPPTIAPTGSTPSPTFSPSESPTGSPTISPTGSPTVSPTKEPTVTPGVPSMAPTTSPPTTEAPSDPPTTEAPTVPPEMSFSYSFSYDFSLDELEVELSSEEEEFGRDDASEEDLVGPPCRKRKIRKVRRVRKSRALLDKPPAKKTTAKRKTKNASEFDAHGENATMPTFESVDEPDVMESFDDLQVYESGDETIMASISGSESEEEEDEYEEYEEYEEIVVCPGDDLYEVSSTSKGKGGTSTGYTTSKGSSYSTSKGSSYSTSKGSSASNGYSTSKGSGTSMSLKDKSNGRSTYSSKGKSDYSLKDKSKGKSDYSSKGKSDYSSKGKSDYSSSKGTSADKKSRPSGKGMSMTSKASGYTMSYDDESHAEDNAYISDSEEAEEDDTYYTSSKGSKGSSTIGSKSTSSKGSKGSSSSSSKGTSSKGKTAEKKMRPSGQGMSMTNKASGYSEDFNPEYMEHDSSEDEEDNYSSKGSKGSSSSSSKGTTSKGSSKGSSSSSSKGTTSKGKSAEKKMRPSGKGMIMSSKASGSMMDSDDEDYPEDSEDAYISKGNKKLGKKSARRDQTSKLRNTNKLIHRY